MTGERFAFVGVFPILGPGPHDLDQLRREAELEQLPHLLVTHRAHLVGPMRWSVLEGRHVAGSGGARWVLTVRAPATRVPIAFDALTLERDDVEGNATANPLRRFTA